MEDTVNTLPNNTPPKLTQQSSEHAHLKTIKVKVPRHKAADMQEHFPKCPNVQLLGNANTCKWEKAHPRRMV